MQTFAYKLFFNCKSEFVQKLTKCVFSCEKHCDKIFVGLQFEIFKKFEFFKNYVDCIFTFIYFTNFEIEYLPFQSHIYFQMLKS